MKIALNVVGVLFAIVGVIWILQGVNVLPGSFMTGQMQWAVYGAVLLALGCVALYLARRKVRR